MQAVLRFFSLSVLVFASQAAWAQPFKLQCDVDGKFADAEGKATAARVGVELQVIGRHLYFTVIGPKPFEMRVSTLVTEEVTYFKSSGLREIEFPGIVKASLQLGKSAESPQTSPRHRGGKSVALQPPPAHPGKVEPQKLHHSRQHTTPTDRQKQKKSEQPWRIRTSHLGNRGENF